VVGAINAYVARMAEATGFRAIYLSGGGVAANSLGLPDLGISTMDDVLIDIRRITEACSLPLLVDADTGWGGAFNIARTVKSFIKAGAAGMHIEDQVQSKRCGHRPGKEVVPAREMVDRVKAAVDARSDASFVIMARSDALASEGLEPTIERLQRCVEAGADAIFPEAITDLPMYRKVRDAVGVPMLANITEFRQDSSVSRGGARQRRRRHRAALLLGVSRHEPRRRSRYRRPFVATARRRTWSRADADARRPLQVSRLPRLRAKLDELFAAEKEKRSEQHPGTRAAQAEEVRGAARASPRQHRAVQRGSAAATICTIAATTSSKWHETASFEELALSLDSRQAANKAELAAYKTKLKNLRGIPAPVRAILEQLPPATHPMDVMRTGASALGCVLPEANDHNAAGAREIADHLVASFGSMLCYWYHFSHSSRRIHVETDDESVGGHFLHLLHRRAPSDSWVRAMHTSLNLYAEHEFNSSTFTARVIAGTGSDIYSCITGAIGALRGPKHGGANEFALEIQERYDTPTRPKRTSASAWRTGKSSRLRSSGVHRVGIRAM
jgi:2-methylisocitrate lyase-like PEP mutase family enzyme